MVCGNVCQATLEVPYLSDKRNLRCATEVTADQDVFSVAIPARPSDFSLPGVPAWPCTHAFCSVFPSSRTIPEIIFWIPIALHWPGPAPECAAREMALIESECMIMFLNELVWYHASAASMASTPAS
jgi:hypothetical protein